MPFEVEITAEAEKDLGRIKPFYRVQILDAIEAHLSHTLTFVSRSRIKRLKLLESPAYRLRINDYRVYYDVDEADQRVTVLRILDQEASLRYLQEG